MSGMTVAGNLVFFGESNGRLVAATPQHGTYSSYSMEPTLEAGELPMHNPWHTSRKALSTLLTHSAGILVTPPGINSSAGDAIEAFSLG